MIRNIALFVGLFLLVSTAGSHAQQAPPKDGGQKKEQQAQKVVDPVCGMQIDPAKAAGKSEYKGTTYYFCSDHCKKTFDANPDAVLNKETKKK